MPVDGSDSSLLVTVCADYSETWRVGLAGAMYCSLCAGVFAWIPADDYVCVVIACAVSDTALPVTESGVFA